MVERSIVVTNLSGLHARPAVLLTQNAGNFECQLLMIKGNKKVDMKSILGVLSLGVELGETVVVRANGQDEDKALKHICSLIENGFGEDEQ